eukprot:TRINITY_DN10581_c0_g2_i2.p1 TRINITY_DN10581_c0_g2~~TRINITY_DN10581_c0_g2_i2.p1  ORF type:complete len:923 (-),score=153.29 TRINITY_DN10581_c0_g2_i2:156-2924(-)
MEHGDSGEGYQGNGTVNGMTGDSPVQDDEREVLRTEFFDEDLQSGSPLKDHPIPLKIPSGSSLPSKEVSETLLSNSYVTAPTLPSMLSNPSAALNVERRVNRSKSISVPSAIPMGYTISIAKTEYRKDGGEKYILYIIEVRDGNNLIVEVKKRFSQLKALHEAICMKFPNTEQFLQFPNKAMPLFSFSEAQFVQQRKKDLENYLRSLLSIPVVAASTELSKFFNFQFEAKVPEPLSCHGCLRSAKESSLDDPRSLITCHHVLCYKCCQNRLIPAGSAAQRGAGSILACPACQVQSPLGPEGVEGLPKAYRVAYLADLVTQMSNLSKSHPSAPSGLICQNCKKANTARFCPKCDVGYCINCFDSIHQIPVFKSHLEEMKFEVAKKEELPPICPVHNILKEKLNLRVWCRDCRKKPLGAVTECKVLLCLQCHYEHHRSHDCVNIETAAAEARVELQQLVDEARAMAFTFEQADQQVRDMIDSVQTNYNANVDKINFVFEELIQVLRQRQNTLIGEVSRIRDEKLKALHMQSKQLTNYLTDLHYSADAAEHMIRHGCEWEVPLTNKVFYDLQVDFNPLTRLPQRTHDDTSVKFVEDLISRARSFGETTAGPIVSMNGNEGAVFWEKLSASRLQSTLIDIPPFVMDSITAAAAFDSKRKVFWVTNFDKEQNVMLWKIDLEANTSSNVAITSFHGQKGFSIPLFDNNKFLYVISTVGETSESRLVRIDVESLEYQNLQNPDFSIDHSSSAVFVGNSFYCISSNGRLRECQLVAEQQGEDATQPQSKWNLLEYEVGVGASLLAHPDDSDVLFFVTSNGKIIRYQLSLQTGEEIGAIESDGEYEQQAKGTPFLRNAVILPSQNAPANPFIIVSDKKGILRVFNSASRTWFVNEAWKKCLITHNCLVYDLLSHSLVYIASDGSWQLIAVR